MPPSAMRGLPRRNRLVWNVRFEQRALVGVLDSLYGSARVCGRGAMSDSTQERAASAAPWRWVYIRGRSDQMRRSTGLASHW